MNGINQLILEKNYSILLFVVFLFISHNSESQSIQGKIYDDASIVRGAKIINLSNRNSAYSDDEGNFAIEGRIGDTLTVTSLFHKTKDLKIQDYFLKEKVVIQLSKAVNDLDEVLLSSNKVKPFNENEYKTSMVEQIRNDMKLNPHLYQPPRAQYGIDFAQLISSISKLLKKKKNELETIELLSYHQLDSIFSQGNHSVLNESFLIKDLNIATEYKALYFDYCDSRGFEKNLLKKENELLLIDKFIHCAEDFLKVTAEVEKELGKN